MCTLLCVPSRCSRGSGKVEAIIFYEKNMSCEVSISGEVTPTATTMERHRFFPFFRRLCQLSICNFATGRWAHGSTANSPCALYSAKICSANYERGRDAALLDHRHITHSPLALHFARLRKRPCLQSQDIVYLKSYRDRVTWFVSDGIPASALFLP